MSENSTATSPDVANMSVPDICGLWEEIRISQGSHGVSYPWLKSRYKYNFLEEKLFLCLKDGKVFHGTWELSEGYYKGQLLKSIILNETFEFIIIYIDEEEIKLTDHRKTL